MMTTSLLVLMAHGSRDPRWRQPFEAMIQRLDHPAVALCYMEMAEPTLAQVLAHHPEITQLTIWPLFWAAGAHVATDIEQQAQQIRDARPGLQVTVLPPMGEHPEIQQAVVGVIKGWLADDPLFPATQ